MQIRQRAGLPSQRPLPTNRSTGPPGAPNGAKHNLQRGAEGIVRNPIRALCRSVMLPASSSFHALSISRWDRDMFSGNLSHVRRELLASLLIPLGTPPVSNCLVRTFLTQGRGEHHAWRIEGDLEGVLSVFIRLDFQAPHALSRRPSRVVMSKAREVSSRTRVADP
jgi:hypothetical protein